MRERGRRWDAEYGLYLSILVIMAPRPLSMGKIRKNEKRNKMKQILAREPKTGTCGAAKRGIYIHAYQSKTLGNAE